MIESIRIEPDVDSRVPTETLRREFPTLRIFIGPERPPTREIQLVADDWATARLDYASFDRLVDENTSLVPAGFAIVGSGPGAERCAVEALTRCQRWIDRRNAESAGTTFDRLLLRHRTMHDLSQSRGRTGYRQALDVWQWVLRLETKASLSVQAAALFLGLGRMPGEPWTRVERPSVLGGIFSPQRERYAADRAEEAMLLSGIHPLAAERTADLVAAYGTLDHDPDSRLLADAGALSFFSLANPGLLDECGLARTSRLVHEALARLSPVHHRHLDRIRLRDDLAALLREETGAATSGGPVLPAAGVRVEDAVA
jgi:hypothetical protein